MKPNHKNLNKTEKDGLIYLKEKVKGLLIPSKAQKKHLLKLIGVSVSFIRTFDAVKIKVPSFDDIKNGEDFELIEVKTTQKKLLKFPNDFFFGMTENEEMLLKVLEPNYKICFISLHINKKQHIMLTYKELLKRIKNKRIQYQIRL